MQHYIPEGSNFELRDFIYIRKFINFNVMLNYILYVCYLASWSAKFKYTITMGEKNTSVNSLINDIFVCFIVDV
jgi:hypothetical protein